jgi:signal transduction histidine kinase/ligand-binding sensor domain-containing protein
MHSYLHAQCTKAVEMTGVLFFAVVSTAFAAGAADVNEVPLAVGDLVVRTWDTHDGLPQNTVYAFAQTCDGFLWIGTSGGLARFDGVRFRNFGLADGLRSVRITSLVEDCGVLWVGTISGLSRYEGGRFMSFGGAEELAATVVECLATDHDETLWIGTEKGLIRLRSGTCKPIGTEEGLPPGQVRTLLLDSHGTLWVSVRREGLFKGSGDHFERATEDGGPKNSVNGLLEDHQGTIWAGDTAGCLWGWRDKEWTQFGPTNGLPANNLEFLGEAPGGELWIGARNDGLYRFADGQARNLTPNGILDGDVISALMVDREGTLWTGTSAGGLHRISRRTVKNWGRAEGIDQPIIHSVAEDGTGRIWACTQSQGIYCSEDGVFKRLKDAAVSANYPYMHAAATTMDGSMWVGGEQCLFRFRAGEKTEAYHDPPMRGEGVQALCVDRNVLWLGTFKAALFKFDGGRLQVVATNGSFPGVISSLALESPETLWVGTTAGLYRWENRAAALCQPAKALLTPNVIALQRDADGTLWIGTHGGGLARLKDGRLFNITTRHGLIDDVVSQIVSDDLGYVWLGCNYGIMRFARRELEDVADGRSPSVHPIVLNRNAGIVKEQCTRGHSPTAIKTKDGRLLFPTMGGLVEIDPRSFTNQTGATPQATLVALLVDGQAQNLEETVVLPPGDHRMEISYAAPSLAEGGWIRFRYRLKQGSQEWIMAGTRRTVTYGKLNPGKYVFQVAACGANNIWNESPDSVAIIVQPSFWQTFWFRGMSALAVCGATFGWYGWRLRRLETKRHEQQDFTRRLINAQEAERARLAREIHDDISQQLAHLAIDADRAEHGAPGTNIGESLRSVRAGLVRVSEDVHSLSYKLHPSLLQDLGLRNALKVECERFSRQQNARSEITLCELPAGLRHETALCLFRITQEALRNIGRHARASAVEVTLRNFDCGLQLAIKDNGVGFDTSITQKQRSLGLVSMRERAHLLGGELDVQSAPGQGTMIVAWVPLDAASGIEPFNHEPPS